MSVRACRLRPLWLAVGLAWAVAAWAAGDVVNLNTATQVQLMSVDGLSRTQAQAIIDYRRHFGDFRAVSGLINVDGIGAATLGAIRDQVTVDTN